MSNKFKIGTRVQGVSFMEDPSWHAKVPTEEQYQQAIKELGV